MDLQKASAERRLSNPILSAKSESTPEPIGHINLGMKRSGKRSSGESHAAFDEVGAGNVNYGRTRDPLHNRKGEDRSLFLEATAYGRGRLLPAYSCAGQSSTLPSSRERIRFNRAVSAGIDGEACSVLLVTFFARSQCRELAQRYNCSYTSTMKTAISLPNDVFEAAEATAKQLGLSRSELYTRAIRAYLEAHGTDRLTEKLNGRRCF